VATWPEASEKCQQKGGALASIASKREEWRVATGTDERRVKLWIGLTGRKSKGDIWRWTTGQ